MNSTWSLYLTLHILSPVSRPRIIFSCTLNSPWQQAKANAEIRGRVIKFFALPLQHYVMLNKELHKFQNLV
jgi:hypothetical protein